MQAHFRSDWVKENLFTHCFCPDSVFKITVSDYSYLSGRTRANMWLDNSFSNLNLKRCSPIHIFLLTLRQSQSLFYPHLCRTLYLPQLHFLTHITRTTYLLDSPTTRWPSSVLIMTVSQHLESQILSHHNSNNVNSYTSLLYQARF